MSPVPLELLAIAGGGFRAETALHRRLAERRCHGEWFELAPGEALAAMREECREVVETWEAPALGAGR
jgi:Meiotically up-regulated gene 113